MVFFSIPSRGRKNVLTLWPVQTENIQEDAELDNFHAARQLKSSLRQSIGEGDVYLPRSSSKRKLSVITSDSHNVSSVARSAYSQEDSFFEDTDCSPILEGVTPPKRLRSNDWPLSTTNPILAETQAVRNNVQPSLRSKKGQHVDTIRYSSAISPGRRSRFLEGSMRDRVSVQPPPEFTGELEESSGFYLTEDELAGGRSKRPTRKAFHYSHRKTASTPHTPNDDVNTKEPGIVRFGKKFASAFGFSGVLQNVWKGPHDGNKPAVDTATDRKARAEKAYAELKASGYPGTNKVVSKTPRRANMFSPVKLGKNEGSAKSQINKKQREGFAIHSDVNKDLPNPPSSLGRHTSSTIRPTKSLMSITPTHKQSSVEKTLPKQSSMRDLLKKEKLKERLTRKVSKLEEEWTKAQQELRALSSGVEPGAFSPTTSSVTPARGRRLFVPGRLPSLPSERLLENQADSAKEEKLEFPTLASIEIPRKRISSAPTPQRELRKSVGRIGLEENTRKRKTSMTSASTQDTTSTEDTEEAEEWISTKKTKGPEPSGSPPTRYQPPRKAKSHKVVPASGYIPLEDLPPVQLPPPNSQPRTNSSRLRSRQSYDRTFTATPGKNGVPPVPPLPQKLGKGSNSNEFEWPDECF